MLVEWGLWRRIKQELFRTIKTNGGYCGYFLYIAFLFLFWGMRWTSSLYIFLYFRNKNERLVLECMKLAPKISKSNGIYSWMERNLGGCAEA